MHNRTVFEKKIFNEVKKLDESKMFYFVWLCGVYSLPYIGCEGNFYFWGKRRRQRYLYSIFYCLDIIKAKIVFDSKSEIAQVNEAFSNIEADPDAFAADVYASVYESSNENESIILEKYAIFAANNARKKAYESANIAKDVMKIIGYIMTLSNIREEQEIRVKNIIEIIIRLNKDFELIILEDLKAINNNSNNKDKNYIEIYGIVWRNFNTALKIENCEYWGMLYERIFNNKFETESNEVERRLNVPPEIRQNGANFVAQYLIELEKGASYINEARIIILGDKGAGKTCTARRLIDPKANMTKDHESTAGVDTLLWEMENNINIRIWDFAGHTVTHAVHQFFLSERCLYILLCNGREEGKKNIEYWLSHMANYGGNSNAIILLNKRDAHRVNIPINTLKEKYNIIEVFEFSVKKDKKELNKFREYVANYIKNNPSWNKQELPTNNYEVKNELEEIFERCEKGKEKEIIEKDVFDDIAKKYEVSDVEILLKRLNDLGIVLWYKELGKYNTLILNPEWISQGIYQIINWLAERKKYSLLSADLSLVFKNNALRFPETKYEFLIELMILYELVYKYNNKGKEYFIIPHLLNEDRPEKLPEFLPYESLSLRYMSDTVLPPNTISRFIVRYNQEIDVEKTQLVWKHGVVLNDGNGSQALVREDDRIISVLVKGTDKTNYLSKIRKTLNDIFSSYKSKKPELEYKIEEFGKIEAFWLREQKILNHVEKNESYYEDNSGKRIDLKPYSKILGIKECDKDMKEKYIKNQIFISYSHKDEEYLNKMNIHLKPISKKENIKCWSDKEIIPGQRWKNEIENAMERAKISILMISKDFLASEFISEKEIPNILKREKENGMVIIPIFLTPSTFHLLPDIPEYQAVNDPKKPLSKMKEDEQDEVFIKLAETIVKYLKE